MKINKLLLPVLAFMAIFTISCRKPELITPPDDNSGVTEPDNNDKPNLIEYENTCKYYINNKVGYTMEILGEVKRKPKLEFKDEGLSKYPLYNNRLSFTQEEKELILKENDYIRASDNTYDSMDEYGNLYLKDTKLDRVLYKHSASENNYLGEVDPNENAVVKKITIYPDKLGSYITGLYAAPGEVITITLSDEDLNYLKYVNEKYNIKDTSNKTFPIAKIIIGQKQERETRENNIWPARDFVRMPLLANTMNINKTTSYVGSFLGGPIYIDLGDKVNISPIDRRPVTFTISGAVEYHNYVHGLTTIKDYQRTSKTSAPFFELGVTDNLVRFSGARSYATNVDGTILTYDDAYECAKLWTKIAKTSHRVPVNSTTDASISFLFEPFVAAGAAVAFPHYNWVNAPLGWFSGALDAHNLRTNGAWGDIHEFNHHHQNYGTGTQNDRLEVSNNATSLLSYVSHTNISLRRKKNRTGVMGDYWNEFLNPEYSLKDTLKRSGNGTNYSLSGYADLIHAFGVETFINICNTQYSYNLAELTNNDERWYYAASVTTGYDMTYYMNDILHLKLNDNIKRIIKNMKLPTYIPAATVYQTGYGIKKDDKIVYSNTTLPYILTGDNKETIDLNQDIILPSDFKIIKSSFTKPNNGDIKDLGNNKYLYTYNNSDSGVIKLSLDVENNKLGIKDTLEFKLEFKVDNKQVIIKDYEYDESKYNQNTNSNYLDEEFNNGFINAKNKVQYFDFDAKVDNIKKNHIVESIGKIYIPKTATYQFGLKTDKSSYLYISKDNKNYELKAYSDSWTHGSFDSTGTKGFTLDLNKGDYLYYKLVTGMPHNNNGYGEIGWGIKKDPNKNPQLRSIDERYVMGVHQTYNNPDYKEFPLEEIKTPYEYNLDNNLTVYDINDDSCYLDDNLTFGILNMFDNDSNTRYHSKRHVNENNPISFIIDLNKETTFNTITFTKFGNAIEAPSDFYLYIGDSKDNVDILVKEFRGEKLSTNGLEAKLDEEIKTRYVKIVVKKTTSNRFFVCADILFKNTGIDTFIHHDSPVMEYQKGTYKANYSVLGTFGKTYDITNGAFKFSFTGTGFKINSSQINPNKLTVIIDGNVVRNIISDNNDVFIIKNLYNTKHEVVVIVEGTLNFNAIKYTK